jgi:creatinine amidohydrolase
MFREIKKFVQKEHAPMTPIRYENLSWTEVQDTLCQHWLIVPFGSVEQHGPHLPLGVDSFLAHHLAMDVADVVCGMVAPVVTYGARSLPNSGGGPSYPGTIPVPGHLLSEFYAAIISGYVTAGARRIFLLNAHWENEAFMFEAIERCREHRQLEQAQVLALSWWSVVGDKEMADIFGAFPGWHAEHAGQAETALMLHYRPDLVRMDKAVDHHDAVPAGLYRYPTPTAWSGNQGVLSVTSHVKPDMGRALAALVKDKLVGLLK